MVTAADGAEEFYSNKNNEARYETVEEARKIDARLINAWIGHPNLAIVDNTNKTFN